MQLKDLAPNPKNPRIITDQKLSMLKKSMEEFGSLDGVIYNQRTKQLVGAHQRQKVDPEAPIIILQRYETPTKTGTVAEGYCSIGGERYPYREVNWDEKKEKAANIAANKGAGAWDFPELSNWFIDLDDGAFDLDLTMFDEEEREKIIVPIQKEAPGCDEDEVPEHVEPKTKRGDIYLLGHHRLMCGDSTDILAVEALMNGEKADMVFTDPPYGVSYENKTQSIANQSKTRFKSSIANDDLGVDGLKEILSTAFSNIDLVLADKSCYYVCSPQGGELGLMMMMMMQEANLLCRHMIIWVKNAPVFSMNRLDYDYRHEPILFGWSKNRTHHKLMEGEFKNSVWEVAREPNKLHPTMKPVILPENAINNSCPRGGSVIDLFGGSGSTLIACEKTNRKCFMMEIDPHYCDVIIARWERYSGQKAILQNTESEQRNGQ